MRSRKSPQRPARQRPKADQVYLLDTNVISELMRPEPHAGVGQWAATSSASTGFATSVVSIHEILFGLTHKPRPRAFERFTVLVARCTVLEVTESLARRAGEMRGALAARGQVRHMADMLIAATAQVHALTLVTRNMRDFDGCGVAVLNPFDA